MLFINKEQPKLFERDVITDERVGPHNNVDLAFREALKRRSLFFLGFEPRKALNDDGPSCKSVLKGLIMLLSEEGRGH